MRALNWLKPWHVALSLVAGGAQFAVADPAFTWLTKVAAATLAGFVTFMVTRFLVARLERSPLLELALVTLYFMFASGVSLPPSPVGIYWIVPTLDGYELASILALGAAVTTTVGFELAYRPTADAIRLLPTITPAQVSSAATYYVPIACVWVLLVATVPALRTASVSVIIDAALGRVPLALVAMYAYTVNPSSGSRLRLAAALGVVTVGMFVSSMLGELALPLTAAGMVWWRQKRKLPWHFALVIFVVGVVLQPVKHHYRDQQWRSGNPAESVSAAWREAFARASETQSDTSASELTQRRVSELSAFAYVVDVTPRLVPHTDGLSYSAIGIGFIPRLIWPDKPNMTKIGADAFTIPIGLHSEEGAENSALAVPVPVHGFIEHGVVGTLSWMSVIGALLGLACRIGGTATTGVLLTITVSLSFTTAIASGFVAFVTSYPKALLIAGGLVWALYGLARLRSLMGASDDPLGGISEHAAQSPRPDPG